MKRLSALMMFGLAVAAPAWAQTEKGPPPTKEPAAKGPALYWYDGQNRKSLWLSSDLVAESGVEETASRVKALDPDAVLTKRGSKKVRIYKLSKGKLARDLLRDAKTAGDAKTVHSEVFRDGWGRGSRLRSLPGEVIVVFRKDWTEARCKEWLEGQKLTVKNKLGFTANAYLLDAPAGMAGLDLANRLYETGDLKISSPNWWMEAKTR